MVIQEVKVTYLKQYARHAWAHIVEELGIG
jgi:hypothetical protein